MDKFSDYKKYFDVDFNKLVNQTLQIKEVKKDIIKYNQDEQLQEGIDSRGQFIETIASQEQNSGYPYSIYTVKLRGEAGLQVDKVDLKDTGAFYNSFDVEVRKDEFEVLADFSKGGSDIRDNFSSDYDFLGLTENSLENFVWVSFFPYFEKNLEEYFAKLKIK